MAALAPPGCPCQPLFPRAAHRVSPSGRPSRPARGRACAKAGGWYAKGLGAARLRPPMGQGRWRLCGSPPRHKRANGPARAAHALGRQNRASGLREPGTGPSILRRRDTPCPATDGAAAKSPPVRSRSRLLAINSPRLTTTGWGPGRYAARASAGPIRNSILSKHLRQLGDVRRDAAGLVPPRPE